MSNRTPGDKIIAIRRTLVPLVWAFIVGLLVEWGADITWLTDRPQTLMLAQLALAAVIYLVAIGLGKKWPWVETAILSSSKNPHYDDTENDSR